MPETLRSVLTKQIRMNKIQRIEEWCRQQDILLAEANKRGVSITSLKEYKTPRKTNRNYENHR